jgi:ABC-type sugar transport system ATPase subunit
VPQVLLEVSGLSKSYGSHEVLRDVDLRLHAGETAALLGENGAGKSTLAKALAGAIKPSRGHIRVEGRTVNFSSPRDALDSGIAFIPQELVYVPHLSAAENICLGRWPGRSGTTSRGAILKRARAEAVRFGFDLPLRREMARLSLAQQQMVEILKAVARDSRVIILDEPTAALNAEDSERLLTLMAGLAERDVGAIYISHRLDEVFRACDTVHVLRDGDLVHSATVAASTPRQIIEHMLGRPMEDAVFDKDLDAERETALRLTGWTRTTAPPLRGVDLQVHRGEIVGLYGVRGAGAETIGEALGGMHRDIGGSTEVDGQPVRLHTPLAARRAGIAYVPADRKTQGLVLTQTIQRSLSMLSLDRISRLGVISSSAERNMARRMWDAVRIRARSLGQQVGNLSGGNQQKVLVGSRLAMRPKVLVLQEPTRGVDVGARLELHRLIRTLADEGSAILLVTSDIEEAVNLSDRLLIIREGAVVDELRLPDASSQGAALQAAGGLD